MKYRVLVPHEAEGQQRAVAYFDQVADAWADRYRFQHAGGQTLRERRERALELLVGSRGRLLDIGCGSGPMAASVVSQGLQFFGVDAAPRMIDAGRTTFEGAGSLTVGVALAEALPFRDASFDVAVCLGVIGAVGDREAAIGEARRVLRPGGNLLISCSNFTSPYAFWKGYVLYPSSSLLRKVTGRMTQRPKKPHRASQVALFTPASCARLLRRHGLTVQQVTYYNFNLLLSPLDRLLGSTAGRLAERLSGLDSTRFRALGTGFIAKAVVDD